MLHFCLLLLFSAVHCVNAVDRDTLIDENVARYDGGEHAYPNLENFRALKNIANFKRQSQDVDDNIAKTSNEKSRKKTNDVLGDDGSEPTKELAQHIVQDWVDLMSNGDIDEIVNKYTEDCIVLYHKNGQTVIQVGRENVKHAYEEGYNQDGIHSVTAELMKEGRLGSEFPYLVDHVTLLDENKNKIEGYTNLLIFKHIKHENGQGGYEIKLTSLVQD